MQKRKKTRRKHKQKHKETEKLREKRKNINTGYPAPDRRINKYMIFVRGGSWAGYPVFVFFSFSLSCSVSLCLFMLSLRGGSWVGYPVFLFFIFS